MPKLDLSDETIEKLSSSIVGKAIKIPKSTYEKKLRNVKLLLDNYRFLENHIDVPLPELKEELPLSNEELELLSLLGYRARSKEMLEFFKTILSRFQQACDSDDMELHRQYDIIYELYIAKHRMTYIQLSEKFNVAESTVRRDEKKAIQHLSVMMFGIDSINDMSK